MKTTTNNSGITETSHKEDHSIDPMIILSKESTQARIIRDRKAAAQWRVVGYGDYGRVPACSSERTFKSESGARSYARKFIVDRCARLDVERA